MKKVNMLRNRSGAMKSFALGLAISAAVFMGAGLVAPSAQAALPVTDGLALWLDASQLTGLIDGDQVDTWTDMSTSGNNAVRTDGSPEYKTGIINGKPVVRFGSGSFDFSRISTIRTVFWVLKENLGASQPRFLLGDSEEYHFHRSDSGPNGPLWEAPNGWSSANIRNGTTKLMGTVVDGTTTALPSETFQLISLITDGNVQANAVSKDRGMTDRSWQGDIAEILIYTRALTSDEEALVGSYLADKYGLTETAYPPLAPPAAPTGLAATSWHHSIHLMWTASPGASGYKVDRLTGSGGTVVATHDASGTSYTDTDPLLADGIDYYYVVRATNSAGPGLPSAEAFAAPSAVPVDQTITFALGTTLAKWSSAAPFADTATSSSGLPVTYSVSLPDQTVATVDPNTGVVTLTGTTGIAHILADRAADADFNAAHASQELTVNALTTDKDHSTVMASPAWIYADDIDTATVTVTLNNADDVPVPGKNVSLVSSRNDVDPIDTISGTPGVSDANGVVTFTVRSTTPGAADFTATDTTDSIVVTQTANVKFQPIITWGPATDDTLNPGRTAFVQTDVKTNGTFVAAVTTGVGGTLNGVTFQDCTAFTSNRYLAFGTSPISMAWAPDAGRNQNGWGSPGNAYGSFGYDNGSAINLLLTGGGEGDSPGTLTLGSLVSNHSYQVQIWAPSWNQTFLTTVGGVSLRIADPPARIPQNVVGTFTADGTGNQMILWSGVAPCGVSLRDVTPTPPPPTSGTVLMIW